MKTTLALTALLLASFAVEAALPNGYWADREIRELLDKTIEVRLAPDVSALSAGERETVALLLEAGGLLQEIYELSKHPQALDAYAKLQTLEVTAEDQSRRAGLLTLYRLSQGPVLTTLDNKRVPFLPVAPEVPGKNVYPPGIQRDAVEAFLKAHPQQRQDLIAERTVVRRATAAQLAADIAALRKYAVIDGLHPGLMDRMTVLLAAKDERALYAVPYALAYADRLVAAHALLRKAADAIEPEDAEFARYLRNRARDLLTNDYESGDAAWITGRFKRLNAQIGAYETYDDALYGTKAFHSFSVLLRNDAATAELRKNLGSLQALEDALPYKQHKTVRSDIPVGVYDVLADFGQARGTNTASILPNDPLMSQRYGRTILLRDNIMRNADLFASDLRIWQAATVAAHHDELTADSNARRTLWHEIGHYLGVERDKTGRTLDVALEDYADAVEEMKSDLVSLFTQRLLHERGELDADILRTIEASGIRRMLQNVKPRADQPYQTMQLVQFNWFVEHGVLQPDAKTARLAIDYTRYAQAVASLLEQTLQLQYQGDRKATAAFFAKYTSWNDNHERLAKRIRDAQGARFRVVRYAALGE